MAGGAISQEGEELHHSRVLSLEEDTDGREEGDN